MNKIEIAIARFGLILSSRPEGREAALILLANELKNPPQVLELNFIGVQVMTPSWLGEFVKTLDKPEIKEINYLHLENSSVRQSVQFTQAFPRASSAPRS